MAFQTADNTVLEEQVLFASKQDAELYGVLYHAKGPMKGAIVVCSPEGDERTWSQRVLVNFSRLLAAHGYTVLRFDYMGQGESGGDYEESTWLTRRNDVESAVEYLVERTEANRVGLHGLRLGGSLALLIASRNLAVKYVTLWEPVIDLRGYFYDLLRVNISFQMVAHKGVVKNRERLIEEILAGNGVSINGFYLTKGFFQEAREADLQEVLRTFRGRCLITLSPGTKFPDGAGGDIVRLDFPVIWKEPKVYSVRPRALMDATINWIERHVVEA